MNTLARGLLYEQPVLSTTPRTRGASPVRGRQLSGLWMAAALFCLPALAQTTPAEAPPLISLEEAIRRGHQVASAVVQAEGQIRVADAGRKRAFGSFLPTLSGSAGVNLSSAERFDPTTNITALGSAVSLSAGLSTSWDLFTGFRRKAELEGSAAAQESARAGLTDQQRAVTFNVTAAYYEALRAGQVVDVASARIQRAQVGLDAADKRGKVGAATRSDVLRARLELNSARTSELQSRTNQRAAELELGRLVGDEGPRRPGPMAEAGTGVAAVDRAALVEEVLQTLPGLTSARASVRIAEATLSSAYAAYWPSLRLSAGYNWFGNEPDYFPGQESWSVRLGLSIPIFDGFARDETAERARVQVATLRSQLAEVERSVRTQVERALDQLSLAAERVTLNSEAVASAREDLRVQQERYELGMTTMLDLLTSQESLVTTENDLVAARFDQDLARAQLEALTGRAP